MRLAAVYIKEHKYLFNNKPQVLNFGGKYFYDFEYITDNEITIYRKENKNYINNFYSNEIISISGIVGANGTGKTSLLKVIHKSYQENTPVIFVYERLNLKEIEYFIDNRIGSRNENGNIIEESKPIVKFYENLDYNKFNFSSYTELYYSPIYDRNISDFHSTLNLESKHPERTLEEIYNESILKEVIFLESNVSYKIKKIYPDFPNYENIIIKPKKLHKRDFTKVYIDSNLGNPNKGETLIHTIERDLRVKNFPNPVNLLNSYLGILKGGNVSDALKDIWNLPKYKNEDKEKSHLIHSSTNFIKNIEISILSFLLLNDIFSVTDLSGSFDFEKILNSKNFEETLNYILAKYIVQTDRRFYKSPEEINIDDYERLIQKCNKLYSSSKLNDEDAKMLHDKISIDINGIKAIRDFYDLIIKNQYLLQDNDEYSYLNINIKNKRSQETLSHIIQAYTKVKKYFSTIPIGIVDFIEIESDKKLSFGEKSLLNMYSTIYEFTLDKNHTSASENYLLILDEADLGYHPLWKRKYIDALNRTLPEIFNTLIPKVFNTIKKRKENSEQKYPKVQIIFTTHDPLTLSDLPNNSIVFLKKMGNFSEVLKIDDPERPTKTFGANISNLLSDSFFINDGLIGDFAKDKIEKVIVELNKLLDLKYNSEYLDISDDKKILIKETIEIIDEPIIKMKLIDMYNTIFEVSLENEISDLEERLKYLKNLKSN
jgi:predicted ATP-binding protein involved in virulence